MKGKKYVHFFELSSILRNYFKVLIVISDETIHDRNCNYQRSDLFCKRNFDDVNNTQEIMTLNYLNLLGLQMPC